MLVDSHCHLNCLALEKDDGDLSKVLERAKKNDVSNILCVCIELANFEHVLKIARGYEYIHASVGIHPNSEQEEIEKAHQLLELSDRKSVV